MPLKTLSGRYADPRKGRGAGINPEGRFEKVLREAFDDGWPQPPAAGEAGERGEADSSLPPLRTHVTVEYAKSIISRNDSPDIPFTQSINPYQGCEHGCIYCLSGDTPILMADGRLRPLADVRTGDMLYGTVRRGWYRRYVKTRVLAHWSTIKPAYRINLEDGTSLIAGPDHRFLTERGWKFVTGAMGRGAAQRPYLTTNNKLMGSGAFAPLPAKDRDYQLGYLCGLVRGDGHLASYHYQRSGRAHGDQHQFRLALCDTQALQQAQEYLRDCQIATQEFVFQRAAHGRRIMHAIRTHGRGTDPRADRLARGAFAQVGCRLSGRNFRRRGQLQPGYPANQQHG
jgi:hypothetical protein